MSQPTIRQQSFFEDLWEKTQYLRRTKVNLFNQEPEVSEEDKDFVRTHDWGAFDGNRDTEDAGVI
jgi:hypothetical protein